MASSSCRIITTVWIPVSWPAEPDEDYTAELNAEILLTWHEPQCGKCEEQDGTCGLKYNSSEEIDCFHHPKSRSSACLLVHQQSHAQLELPFLHAAMIIAIKPGKTPQSRTVRQQCRHNAWLALRLDESTIESYEKMVLGKSRRIPGPNDGTCPICLSEYLSKDTIKCIPQCKHCFHAECIDEWLRMNTTCPVCRNKPSAGDADPHNDPV
ncbi:hypothetical protein V6N13_045521 [Hibiscus sabdariffa]|uniref:RING-type E3 ubiquitin transferase n=1 Tax=Hibiscus sabdariffa TaxID=183260 RepID=A0ABR2RLP0_9ROSI